MADNIDVTPGTGKTIAADDIAGVLHQRVKVSVGADGSATDLAPGQATMANSLPVVLASNQSNLTVAAAAGENHMGQIGGQIVNVALALTVTASAYSSGNCIGGKLTLSNLARANDITGRITKLVMQSKSLQTFAFDVVLFNADPSSSTFTDKGTFDVVAADWDKVIGVIHVSDWTALGATRSVAQALALNIPFTPVSGARTLHAAIVVRSTPTPGSTSDFKLLISNDSD